jgi:hypothetical protein
LPHFLILCLIALAVPAGASTFTIPLPELVGAYGTYESAPRTATFHLPGTPAVVRGATLHLVGTTEVGVMTCDTAGGGGETTDSPWPTETFAEMNSTPDGLYMCEHVNPNVAGAFESFESFFGYAYGSAPVTWDFLLDGEGSLTLSGFPVGMVLCSSSGPPPTLAVTGAWMVVDADIPTPAPAKSWGALKAAYR